MSTVSVEGALVWRGESLGRFVKKARERIGMTQADFALNIGKNITFAADLERGRMGVKDRILRRKIAAVLDVELGDLYAAQMVYTHDLHEADPLAVLRASDRLLVVDFRRELTTRGKTPPTAEHVMSLPMMSSREIVASARAFHDRWLGPHAEAVGATPICDVVERLGAAKDVVERQEGFEWPFVFATVPDSLNVTSAATLTMSVLKDDSGQTGIIAGCNEGVWRRAQRAHPRARFVAARALAHGVLHAPHMLRRGKALGFAQIVGTSYDLPPGATRFHDPTWQANVWAQELLVPSAALKAVLDAYEGFEQAPIIELADYFLVTPPVMMERIERFLAEPLALAIGRLSWT